MKAYVIKNKEGEYYQERCRDTNYIRFESSLIFAELFSTKYSAEAEKDFILRNEYKFGINYLDVIPITIYEGDPLELACYETDNSWNEQKAFKKNMPLYDYFIQQAKETIDGK